MNFTIITHVVHGKKNGNYFGYAPYIREMNIWLKYADEVTVVAPLENVAEDAIHLSYNHDNLHLNPIEAFSFTSLKNALASLVKLPGIVWVIYKAMKKADHIHLRCPGNMGLLGAIIQVFFPNKIKTAKYAGNWDPSSKQPLTYKLQRWILSNTFLTKNMQVLVYGDWKGSTENIKSFFTATYSNNDLLKIDEAVERETIAKRLEGLESGPIRFLFVGTLAKGKQPMYAIKLVEAILGSGRDVTLQLFGEGALRSEIKKYIEEKNLSQYIELKGNQTKELVEEAYRNSHFMLLPSMSEGWPKVVAEAMFWGCVPVATRVSCVPYMVDYGKRGLLLEMNLEKDTLQVLDVITNQEIFRTMSEKGKGWSREFTLEKFESEIQKLIH